METIKYFFEFNDNRSLAEDTQGFAELTMISNQEQGKLTNLIMAESMAHGKKKTSFDYNKHSVTINERHIENITNVRDPLTDEVYPTLTVRELYQIPQLKELYAELSEAIDDVNKLKDGIKKK